jgi:uncharacterized protein
MSANDSSPLANSEVHYLRSTQVGDEFKIFVGHCGSSDDELPTVLYLTDANGMFASAVEVIRFMQLARHLPSILVVGIGYRMGTLDETIALRTRDLTPTADPAFSQIFPKQTMMGGARLFLEFIGTELKPWVHSRYDIDTNDSAFFGHSMGGLFGTYVLLTQPHAFRRYGIGSPSLWWDNDAIFQHEARYAQSHGDLSAKVFFSVGGFEDHDGRQREAGRLPPDERAKAGLRFIDMVADTERIVEVLSQRRYPSLHIGSETIPEEFHVTVQHVNLSRSLRFLFDAPL